MNIVDRLTGLGREQEMTQEQKTRHDVLFSQLRARTGLPAENIDLSEVDFDLDDDALRAEVAKARGITSEIAISEIDLDEVVIPSGSVLRTHRRKAQRAEAKRRRRGQRKFNRQQRARRAALPRESGSARVKAGRIQKLQQEQVAALIAQGVDPREAYERVVGRAA